MGVLQKIGNSPKNGGCQIVEIRETVKEIVVPVYVIRNRQFKKSPIFSNFSDELLLSYGVPQEWLADVRQVNEETLLELTDHLPAEAAEALLEIATGGKPQVVKSVAPVTAPIRAS